VPHFRCKGAVRSSNLIAMIDKKIEEEIIRHKSENLDRQILNLRGQNARLMCVHMYDMSP